MMPPATAAMLARIRSQITSGKPEWTACEAAETTLPVERYLDPAICQAETRALFRSLPLVAAHTSELAPGQALAHDSFELPLLLTRDTDGQVHAFLNVCRHRGMRLLPAAQTACSQASVVCPYHGWTYRLDGTLRHMLHAEAFDPCPSGARDLIALPCAERHGLIWVLPDPEATMDLPGFLAGLDAELPFMEIDKLQHFRTVEADYPANWKLILDAFLEGYHIRVLHRDTIFPFFLDNIAAVERLGPHTASLVGRRAAEEWAQQADPQAPTALAELSRLATSTQVIFPNTITIFHPDYLSLISVYPRGPEKLHWVHRMLIPRDKATPDWTPHWEKTFRLIEQGVFQKEDIHCAIGIQQGLASGANRHSSLGRLEQSMVWFHDNVMRAIQPAKS